LLASSLVAGTYEKTIDRESAYEKLKGRAAASSADPDGPAVGSSTAGAGSSGAAAGGGVADKMRDMVLGTTGPRGGRHAGLVEKAASSAVRSIGSAVGREIIRGVLGSLFGGSRRR
ncbi:MAG TPA: helicase HerA-like domain-containing protein, partial [Gemmatimonadales bacterium]|nr:helicase HerA-like domain-containing protein [Gemmatimonadales bacterium]